LHEEYISNSKNSWLTSENKNRSIYTYFAAASTTTPLRQGDGDGVPSKSNRINPVQQEWHIRDLLHEEYISNSTKNSWLTSKTKTSWSAAAAA